MEMEVELVIENNELNEKKKKKKFEPIIGGWS